MLIIQNGSSPATIRNAIVDLIDSEIVDMRVASAYVTTGGSDILFDAIVDKIGLKAFLNMKKVLIASLDYGLTEPDALRKWCMLENTLVNVFGAQGLQEGSLSPLRAFHPKLYVFGNRNKKFNALIGSANLTSRGFSVNTEAAWTQNGIPLIEIESAFSFVEYETVHLTEDLLNAYENLRQRNPPPKEIEHEIKPVDKPHQVAFGELTLFRLAIERNIINPENFTSMWVQGEGLQGGSRNQLELPRGGHRFFGFHFDRYDYPDKITIGRPVLRSGSRVWTDRLLTWHGNNRMERMNLPTVSQGGYNYANTAVMFRRLKDGSFEIIVTPWDSDLSLSWRHASLQKNTMFRLGTIATNRLVGLI